MLNKYQSMHFVLTDDICTYVMKMSSSAGNSPVTGEFPSQRPVTQSFDAFLISALNKRLSKRSWGWLFETPSRSLWRHCNVVVALLLLNPEYPGIKRSVPWPFILSQWHHEMETFSALLTLCEENPSVTGGFPSQRPVIWSFDVFFDLRLNKQCRKQSRHR